MKEKGLVKCMKLTFIGADHEVTGSCHLLQANGKNILIDYGMEQGRNLFENQPIPVPENEIDYVLLTHAHIDHSGMLPLLCRNGFKGQVVATIATTDLCQIMLRDSAHIQEFEAEWKNRKGKRSGAPVVEPIYEMQDAENVLKLFLPCAYKQKLTICPGIQVRFTDVGHLLGSASIEVWITEEDVTKKIVFSGDVGNIDQPIIKDPQYTKEADYVVVESTYGNRVHSEVKPDYIKEFTQILNDTFARGGNLVIPSFAVGRTQEILYFIREIKEKKLVTKYPNFEVYVDSPLAIEATQVFSQHETECFDEDAMKLVKAGINPIQFPGLKTSTTSQDSININLDSKSKVIISASGMCDAGRIRHHLKHNLWRAECTVLFVGYQAEGTLGRKLLDGETQVKIFGEPIEVRARILNLDGISGHADMNGLLKWLHGFTKKAPEQVFVVHGEDSVTDEFAATVREELGCKAFAPYSGGQVDLATGEIITEGERIPIQPKKAARAQADSLFERLVLAGKYLLGIIYKNEGLANKDKAKFETQIYNLAEKWDPDISTKG